MGEFNVKSRVKIVSCSKASYPNTIMPKLVGKTGTILYQEGSRYRVLPDGMDIDNAWYWHQCDLRRVGRLV